MVSLGFADADIGILSIVCQHPSQCAIGYACSVLGFFDGFWKEESIFSMCVFRMKWNLSLFEEIEAYLITGEAWLILLWPLTSIWPYQTSRRQQLGLLCNRPFPRGWLCTLRITPAALGIPPPRPRKAAIRLLHPLVRDDPAQLSKSSQGSHPHNLALLISQITL